MLSTLKCPVLIALLIPLVIACDTKEEPAEEEVEETTPDVPVETTWYTDADGDGFGNASAPVDAVEQPNGHVADNTDCDDTNDAINPDAAEVCNLKDDDCDTEVDEEASDASTFYADTDADGFGDAKSTIEACELSSGYVEDSTDCNDASALQHPGADELCNLEDDDCDLDIDEEAIDAGTFYADIDADGFGDTKSAVESCEQPSDHVTDGTDCDDTDDTIYPDAEDGADGIDQDCDGADGFAFSVNFESFTVGDYIGQDSDFFATWTTGSEGGDEDATVTDDESYTTGTQSVVLNEASGDDLVLLLGPTSGSWLVEWYMYVDTGAYFNLQGLVAPFGDWQKEVHVDETGLVDEDNASTGLEVSVGQWVLVEYYVDIDSGTQDLWIDSTLVISDYFSGLALGGIDFFPTIAPNAETEDYILFYIDDVVFSELGK